MHFPPCYGKQASSLRLSSLTAISCWQPIRFLPALPSRNADLKNGANTISVKVTNTWFNSLACDASLPEEQRKT